MATENKSSLPTSTELAGDLKTIQGLVDKYAVLAPVLPGVLGSALGGLRTALRGFSGHLAQQNAESNNAQPGKSAAPAPVAK